MAARKYFRSSIMGLEQMFQDYANNRDMLGELLDELCHRKTPRAKKLKEKVEQALMNGNTGKTAQEKRTETKTAEAKDSATTSQPKQQTTWSNIPDTTPQENISLDIDATDKIKKESSKAQPDLAPAKKTTPTRIDTSEDELIPAFIEALSMEIEAIREHSRETSIDLYNGQKVEESVDNYVYRFRADEELYLREDSPVMVVVGDRESSGTVVSVSEKGILVAIDDDYGPVLSHVQIRVDDSFLVERLKTQFEEIQNGEREHPFNSSMMFKVTGIRKPSISEGRVDTDNVSILNDEQKKALIVSEGSETTFVWGPPGTGKTYTLARVIDGFYQQGKRILVVSNTNLAVDTLVEKFCDHLSGIEDPEFERGSVVRYGTIVKEELADKYTDFVDLASVVERLSAELVSERDQLLTKREKIDNEISPLKAVISVFEKLEHVLPESTRLQTEIGRMENQISRFKEQLAEIGPRHEMLQKKLVEARQTGALVRLLTGKNPEKIEREIQQLPEEEAQLRSVIESVGSTLRSYRRQYTEIVNWIRSKEEIVEQYKKGEVAKKIAELEKQIQPIATRLIEIESALAKIRDEVLHNCRVLAGTATQSYLKSADFQQFDVVVIDEASMLVLPLVSYTAGLAREKVIVAGDFRQLPPIVQSKSEAAAFWLARTIFHQAGIVDAVNSGERPANLVQLNSQYRMDAKICDLINERFYGGTLRTAVDTNTRKQPNSYPQFLSENLTIINTASQMPFASLKPNTYSRYNLLHVLAIRTLIQWMADNEYINDREDIGVITPYSHQAKILDRVFRDMELDAVTAGTVHRFQGNEKDIILFDVTDSYGLWKPSHFISADQINDTGANLLNVAMSRAKSRLIMLANLDYLEDKLPSSSYLMQIIGQMKRGGQVVDVNEIFDLSPDSTKFLDPEMSIPQLSIDPKSTSLFNEKTFEQGFLSDIKLAEKSIVIFSGFSTPARVAKLSDMLRYKMEQGVKVRVVTRPPYNQGSIGTEIAREAVYPLHKMGVVVDLRYGLHEKICFIDGKIVWSGSLNPLSYTGATSEKMMRMCGEQGLQTLGESLILVHRLNRDLNAADILAQAENPLCPNCGSLTVFHPSGRYGPYFDCETKCGWSISLDKYRRQGAGSATRKVQEDNEDIAQEERTCPECGNELTIRKGRYGRFWGCKAYPKCRHTEKV